VLPKSIIRASLSSHLEASITIDTILSTGVATITKFADSQTNLGLPLA
jgi:hypothetical protein